MIPEPPGWTDDHESAFMHALSRRTTDRGRLQRWLLLLHREHRAAGMLPTSGRFLFYELEQRGGIGKARRNRDGTASVRRADTDLSEALTRLREARLVPWADVVDETRDVTVWEYAESTAAYLLAQLDTLALDLWAGEPPPLVVVESRSLQGALRDHASTYLAPITSTNGQSSGALLVDLARHLTEPRPVLYLGDLDLAGGQIETSTRLRLDRHGAHVDDWTRVAITREQVDAWNADPDAPDLDPIRKVDRRYRGGRAYDAWETEALGQAEVVRLLRAHLDGLRADRGLPSLADVHAREQVDRERWARLLPLLDQPEAERLLAPLLDTDDDTGDTGAES